MIENSLRAEPIIESDTHCKPDLGALISEIREHHRWRTFFMRSEKSLTLQAKSQCRRVLMQSQRELTDKQRAAYLKEAGVLYRAIHNKGEHPHAMIMQSFLAPTLEALALQHKSRLYYERLMSKLAMQLPVWPWVDAINGLGALGLAQIVGEAGDLNNYANPAKLWKRFGLAVINGKSQRKVTGEGAIEQGYSPQRRSIMFCIGDSLLKKQNAYRELYLQRKVYETNKLPDGTKLLWHRRAQRYVEKRVLKDLWEAWK